MDDREMQRAARLIEQALQPHAHVEQTGKHSALALRLRDGSRTPLQLTTGADDQVLEGKPNVVRVLTDATRADLERLRREARSFVDLKGAVFLTFPNLLVDRTGVRLQTHPAPAMPFDAFSDRSSLIVRRLLGEGSRDREWGIREIAQASDVAPATATRAARELERERVVQISRSGRNAHLRLTDPRGLFMLWTRRYDWSRNAAVAFDAPVGEVSRFVRRLPELLGDTRWALTLQAGAAQVAPHATWDRVHLYLDVESAADLLRAGAAHGWEPAPQGQVVLMKPYYRTSVWHGQQTAHTLPVVSTLQLALDLWHYPLRGREQAEHLLASVPGLRV